MLVDILKFFTIGMVLVAGLLIIFYMIVLAIFIYKYFKELGYFDPLYNLARNIFENVFKKRGK